MVDRFIYLKVGLSVWLAAQKMVQAEGRRWMERPSRSILRWIAQRSTEEGQISKTVELTTWKAAEGQVVEHSLLISVRAVVCWRAGLVVTTRGIAHAFLAFP